jgi:hypothetical protein
MKRRAMTMPKLCARCCSLSRPVRAADRLLRRPRRTGSGARHGRHRHRTSIVKVYDRFFSSRSSKAGLCISCIKCSEDDVVLHCSLNASTSDFKALCSEIGFSPAVGLAGAPKCCKVRECPIRGSCLAALNNEPNVWCGPFVTLSSPWTRGARIAVIRCVAH